MNRAVARIGRRPCRLVKRTSDESCDPLGLRVRPANAASSNKAGKYVLYWMTAARRVAWNFALQRAVQQAKDLDKPLVVVETLSAGHRWANRRHHQFAIQGMAENARQFHARPVRYYPFAERAPGECLQLVTALAQQAALVVADDYPMRRFAAELDAVARQAGVLAEQVDSNGLLPMRAATAVFPTAYAFRRFLQKNLPEHLPDAPQSDPLARVRLAEPIDVPRQVARLWPALTAAQLDDPDKCLVKLPIDQSVAEVETCGGAAAARKTLKRFLQHGLARYADDRNQLEENVASGLSPFLHHGHISVHEVFDGLARHEGWSPDRLGGKTTGDKEGWWSMSAPAEAFLDELVTWREVGFNFCSHRDDYDRYESLPDWARKTLESHADDRREHVYSLAELERSATHDDLWNAAQRELVRTGRMHNYLRMLWGKKILEWSPDPREALDAMIELNNKYALDGEDPNSYSGICWVLGRYDRPWGPERAVFGTIRYMSSENTARKLRIRAYLAKYAPAE